MTPKTNPCYSSLTALRTEKQRIRRQLQQNVQHLKADTADCFLPRDRYFFDSPIRYVNWLGYALTAYKTFMSVRGAWQFISRLRK